MYGGLYFTLLSGDFNAKPTTWYINNQNTIEGTQSQYLTSLYEIKQLHVQPTLIVECFSNIVALIFTNQQNLIMDSGVH